MIALQAEGRELSRKADLRVEGELRLVGARHAHDLETDDAPRKVAAAARAADSSIDARCRQVVRGVALRLGLGRRRRWDAHAGAAGRADLGGELVLGVAVHASQRDLTRGRRDRGDAWCLLFLVLSTSNLVR